MDSTDQLLNNMSEKRKRYLAKIAEQIDPENNIYKESIEKEMEAKGNQRKKIVYNQGHTFRAESSLSSIDSYAYDNSSAENSLSHRHGRRDRSKDSGKSPESQHKKSLGQLMQKIN